MSFFHPGPPENVKFSYNVLTAVLLVLTATLMQLTGAWVPFVIAGLFAGFIAWQLYIRNIFRRELDISDEDRNKIAYHELLTGEITRVKTTSERQVEVSRRQTERIDTLVETVERLEKTLNTQKRE